VKNAIKMQKMQKMQKKKNVSSQSIDLSKLDFYKSMDGLETFVAFQVATSCKLLTFIT
jgi:hypothetical protein